jgi:hypothetical protein
MLSTRLLAESTGSWQESTGKNPDNFRPEYCFHVSAISGAFLQNPVPFLQDQVPGIIDLDRPTPASVRINLWKKRLKSTVEYSIFQYFCLKNEYNNRYKDKIRHEKEINKLLEYLKLKISHSDSSRYKC